jgi:hypothetical protein
MDPLSHLALELLDAIDAAASGPPACPRLPAAPCSDQELLDAQRALEEEHPIRTQAQFLAALAHDAERYDAASYYSTVYGPASKGPASVRGVDVDPDAPTLPRIRSASGVTP